MNGELSLLSSVGDPIMPAQRKSYSVQTSVTREALMPLTPSLMLAVAVLLIVAVAFF
jgi:hypothetical protein